MWNATRLDIRRPWVGCIQNAAKYMQLLLPVPFRQLYSRHSIGATIALAGRSGFLVSLHCEEESTVFVFLLLSSSSSLVSS